MDVLASVELAVSGLLLVWLGAWLRRSPRAFDRLCTLLASPPPAPAERRRLPAFTVGTGVAWLLVTAAEVFPYPHGSRPYAVTVLAVLLLAAAAVTTVGLLAWLTVLRRFNYGARRSKT